MNIRFENRTALVTGGTKGIGAAIAKAIADSGGKVIAVSSKSQLDYPGVRTILTDLSSPQGVEELISKISTEKIDILVNNAGINKIALVGDIDPEDWDRIQDVNLRAPFMLSRSLLPQMAKRGYGRVVNISSVFGCVSKSMRASYSTSKFGLIGLTRASALDYASHGVLVNAVSPGFIDTDLTRTILNEAQILDMVKSVPMGRLGTPEEIARVVAFLASEANSFITGQNIVADGGFTSA